MYRLAGDQRARRDARHDSDAEDDDDVKKVKALQVFGCRQFTCCFLLQHHWGIKELCTWFNDCCVRIIKEKQKILKVFTFSAGVAVVCSSYLQGENTPRPHSRSDHGREGQTEVGLALVDSGLHLKYRINTTYMYFCVCQICDFL